MIARDGRPSLTTWVDRVGSISGLVAVGLILASVGMGDPYTSELPTDPEAPSADLAEALVANSESARVGAYLGLLAVFFLLIFIARLHSALRPELNGVAWVPTLALGGGLLIAVAVMVENGFVLAASVLGDYGDDTQVAKFFVLWQWESATLLAPGFTALLTSGTLSALSSRAAPRWFRWASVALLTLVVLIAGVMRAPGLATAPGAFWVVLVSVLLIARPSAFVPRADMPVVLG